MALLLCMVIALVAPARRARAQDARDTSAVAQDGWIVGGMLGLFGSGRETAPGAFTIGVVATRLIPNRPGVELALGTAPRSLTDGFLTLGARAGIALPLALNRNAFLIPTAGVSGAGGLSSDGGGGAVAVYGGLSTVVSTGSVGVRTGITVHHLQNSRSLIWLLEAGVAHVPLQRRSAQ